MCEFVHMYLIHNCIILHSNSSHGISPYRCYSYTSSVSLGQPCMDLFSLQCDHTSFLMSLARRRALFSMFVTGLSVSNQPSIYYIQYHYVCTWLRHLTVVYVHTYDIYRSPRLCGQGCKSIVLLMRYIEGYTCTATANELVK